MEGTSSPSTSGRRAQTRVRRRVFGAIAAIIGFGCSSIESVEGEIAGSDEIFDEQASAIEGENGSGDNLSGINLSGANLSGMNLSGANLSGANMGGNNLSGVNLSGMNLSGINLSGVNMGGTNLGGQNMSATNLSGANLSGVNLSGPNLSGINLSGMNLSGVNLSGANTAGTNLSGPNLSGMNLSGVNLSGANSGANIHNLPEAEGMLYSREDLWMPPEANGTNSSQRIVLGIGSTAFPRFLAEQSPNAKINVALGKLPWGFASTSGGSTVLDAWEAVIWGDNTYNVFIMTAPPGANWAGIAGFIKAIFRWNAPPTQSMDISGIEASAAFDPTVQTTITTYTGMFDTAAKLNAGTVAAKNFMAGEFAFITATTNNLSVMVDFSGWVMDTSGLGTVLANVQSTSVPTKIEAVFYAVENDDQTVQVNAYYPDQNGPPVGMTDNVRSLDLAWGKYAGGNGIAVVAGTYRPVPLRCTGALFLKESWGKNVPAGKCDPGLKWNYGPATTYRFWNTVSGTTAPMNGYMSLPYTAGNPIKRPNAAGIYKNVMSETYVHMWNPGHALNRAAGTNSAPSTKSGTGTLCAPGTTTTFTNEIVATGAFKSYGPFAVPAGGNLRATSSYISGDPNLYVKMNSPVTSITGNTAASTLPAPYNDSVGPLTVAGNYYVGVYGNSGAAFNVTVTVDQGSGTSSHNYAFDNSAYDTGATQWCVTTNPTTSVPVSVMTTVASTVAKSYQVITNADDANKDPKDWTLQGCSTTCTAGSDTGWVTLDTRTNQVFGSRIGTNNYTLTNTTAYTKYRMRITATKGGANGVKLSDVFILDT